MLARDWYWPMQMWAWGMIDYDIAAILGMHASTIGVFRRVHNLPSRGDLTKNPRPCEVEALMRLLYDAGATDRQIAREVCMQPQTIASWRTKLHLPKVGAQRQRDRKGDDRQKACRLIHIFALDAERNSDADSLFADPETTKRVLGFTCPRLAKGGNTDASKL